MPRPRTLRYDRLLEAAREVFLADGPAGTMREIAERAGMAEGSIYRFVQTKEQLFRQATDTDRLEPRWLAQLLSRVGRGELTTELVEAGMQSTEFFRLMLRMLMVRGAVPKSARKDDAGAAVPAQVLRQIAGYFAAEQQLGRIHKKVDPDVLGRAYVGGLMSYAIYELAWPGPQPPAEGYVRALVRLLWSGCAPAR